MWFLFGKLAGKDTMDPMGKVPWIFFKFPDAHHQRTNDQAEVKSSEATSFGSFFWLEKITQKHTQHTAHAHTWW